ncbi:MAG: C40 family peptidase [Pedobacter sp.]|nr:C40 family peptidase [Pedobacter sp.]
MKKTLLLFCLLCFFAFTSKAQENTSLTQQYQKMMGGNLLDFAKSMIGVPYRYASSNPNKGFDCSGFVNYVFQNFGFKVPRSSPEFARAGVPVKLGDAKVGDVLIFTGSNPKVREIGHVGIISSIEDGEIKFIHSSSGKAHGVTITNLDGYYKSRFMKAVSIIE